MAIGQTLDDRAFVEQRRRQRIREGLADGPTTGPEFASDRNDHR
jgi:hypothetical protein